MCQGSSLDLEIVVRQLPGRDAPLRLMYTPHGVPVVRILLSQLHSVNGRRASAGLTILTVVDI